MNNILEHIGDILVVKSNPKIIGRVTFSGYLEDIIGETVTRSLTREFRISSSDGLFWTEWKNLNEENLSSKQYIVENSLLIEVSYTRTGTDESGVIEFNDIQFLGSREEIKFIAPTISSSLFNGIIGSDNQKKIEANLFKKLYYRGILPTYITRGDNNDESEDKDFIDLFLSMSRFFGMFISFFKRFENFNNDFSLMREQVRQYGIYFDESNVTLEELKYLAEHIYDEMRKRGTNMIFHRKGDILPNGKKVVLNGEFLRLLRNKESDELLYENVPLNKMGWCLRNSSPMYCGTSQAYNLNKTRENTQDFQDSNNFVLNSEDSSSFDLESYESRGVLSLKSTNGRTGIGRIDSTQDIDDKMIVVDSRMDYEITFAFKVDSGDSDVSKILFGVEGFDVMKNLLNDSFITPNGNSVSEIFFERSLDKLNKNCWYFARGIIHAYSSNNVSESKTNLGFGTNLYFNNSFVKFISPKIQLNGNGIPSEVNIWDFKVRPLTRGTNILPLKNGTKNSRSLGFTQVSNIFYTYVRNNNNSQSEAEITNIVSKYLYSFNKTNVFVFMSNY